MTKKPKPKATAKKVKGKTKSKINIPEKVNIFEPMTKADFSKIAGVSAPMITKGVKEGLIFATAPGGQVRLVDNLTYLMIRTQTDLPIMSKPQQAAMTKLLEEIRAVSEQLNAPGETPASEPHYITLLKGAKEAALKNEIYTAQIKEQKKIQEQIKTAEMKRDLAPVSLIKYFFSFAETIVQRNYRRVKEIQPEIESLISGGKSDEAIKLLLREQENIAHEAQKKLIREIEEEGLKYEI